MSDVAFQIRHDGHVYDVHTEVGDGLTRVVFDDTTPAEPPRSLEENGDAS